MRSACLRLAASAIALATAAAGALARPAETTSTAHAGPPYQRVMEQEAQSKALCEASPNRVFVRHKLGTECIAYYPSRGFELQRRAVLFLEGDLARDKMDAETQAKILDSHRRSMQAMADRFGMPFIAVARPGVLGSSGHHGWRRRPAESLTINAAVDAIKARLGLDFVTLVGQSGGSTMAASLLTMGRNDIVCAVLGSGNMAVVDLYLQRQNPTGRLTRESVERSFYDPARHIDGILRDAARRVIVIGDPEDTRTPFHQQQRFAERLQAAGHRAQLIAIAGNGPDNHGAVYAALPAAGMCTLNMSDKMIAQEAANRSRIVAAKRAAGATASSAASGATATR